MELVYQICFSLLVIFSFISVVFSFRSISFIEYLKNNPMIKPIHFGLYSNQKLYSLRDGYKHVKFNLKIIRCTLLINSIFLILEPFIFKFHFLSSMFMFSLNIALMIILFEINKRLKDVYQV